MEITPLMKEIAEDKEIYALAKSLSDVADGKTLLQTLGAVTMLTGFILAKIAPENRKALRDEINRVLDSVQNHPVPKR